MKTTYLFLLLFLIPTATALTYTNVQTLPVNCTGNITADTYDYCRHITCTQQTGTLSALACNKPGDHNPKTYEIYNQFSIGQAPTLCIGSACLSNNGYAKGTFPYIVTDTQPNTTSPSPSQDIYGTVVMQLHITTKTPANCSVWGQYFDTTGNLSHDMTLITTTGISTLNITCINNTKIPIPYINTTPPVQNTTNVTIPPYLPPLTYRKYANNPVGYTSTLDFAPEVAHGEPSGFIENDTLYYWYHTHSPGHVQQRIIAGSTKNPYNMTTDNRYILHQFDNAYAYLEVRRKAQNDYYMAIERYGSMNIYHSTDKTTWTDYCGHPIITTGAQNPSLTWDTNGTWHLVIENVGSTISYYTSTNGCDWTNNGIIQGRVDTSPYLGYHNNTFIMYDTWYDGISKYNLRLFRGNTPKNLTLINNDLLKNEALQAWEKTIVTNDPADSFLVIIPPESQQYFDKPAYLYYVGDQNQTGVII